MMRADGRPPFSPPWNQTDEEREEEYLQEMKRLSIQDFLLAEEEYGDGNIEIADDDYVWAEVDFWWWT